MTYTQKIFQNIYESVLVANLMERLCIIQFKKIFACILIKQMLLIEHKFKQNIKSTCMTRTKALFYKFKACLSKMHRVGGLHMLHFFLEFETLSSRNMVYLQRI